MPLRSQRFAGNPRLEAAANNSPPLRRGSSGEAVAILQQALIDRGYDMPITTACGAHAPDGIYGDETASVVARFQADEGLQRDGIAGHDTIGRLDDFFFRSEQNERLARQPVNPRNWWVATVQKSTV
jgi:peptidoglycan hydrolase-like protein with peptidoglycan-binding domain